MAKSYLPVQDISSPAVDAPATGPGGGLFGGLFGGLSSLLGNSGTMDLMGGPKGIGPTGGGDTSTTANKDAASPTKESSWWGDYVAGVKQEGFWSIFDPTGAVDRQRAQRELAGNFDIIGSDFTGEKKPNQVTQEEFQKAARMYSDIRLGRGDLVFDTGGLSDEDAKAFRDGTMNDIGNILQTPSGRELISRLSDQKDDYTTKLTKAPDPLSASENADNFTDGTNGKGSGSKVQYVPGVDVTVPGAKDDFLPFRSDAVLYHELTHALYDAEGTTDAGTVAAGSGVAADVGTVKNYEHQAVGLGAWKDAAISENRYRSERNQMAGQPGSRAGDATMKQRTQYSLTF